MLDVGARLPPPASINIAWVSTLPRSCNELVFPVIDEIHTPDSSRYWIADGYQARFEQGADQEMLDKENIGSGSSRSTGSPGTASRRRSPTRSG